MDPTQLQPGYRLDRYELLCPLAYGGMASVWLARFGGRLGFERMVVVKMILPQFSQDPRFQEMFLDEARIASRIEHTNVARILDVGEHDGNYFIVMEWVDGDSLSKVMRAAEQKKTRVPAGVALRICADAAAGLHAAHELKDRDGHSLGVVHRDVSPQNILISNNGATMLIDFGVAKARDRVSQDTSAGQLKGKIRYMAPEQALGRQIDRRADVWALGAILYELFAGTSPYEGVNEVATLHKLTSGQPPAPMPPSVPAPVKAVISRALAYDPENRYATTLELSLALESAMVEIGDPTSITAVAAYTMHLLAERKAARRRAVDAALQNARARDAAASTSIPTQPVVPVAAGSNPNVVTPAATAEIASAPGSMGGAREPSSVPSTTSSATLGSAAIEYPPQESLNPFDQAARRKRYVVAAVLGVSLAAGVVGAILIVSAAMTPRADETARTNVAAAPTEVVEVPAEPTAEPVATATAAATATMASPVAAVAPSASSTAAATTPSPSTSSSAVASASASSSAVAAHTTTESTTSRTNSPPQHKPPPQPIYRPPPPKQPPTPPPTPTPKKPDYGF